MTRVIEWLATLMLVGACTSACTSPNLAISPTVFTPSSPSSGPEVVVLPAADSRIFSISSHPAPTPSLRGDPQDSVLTSRIVGRRYMSSGMLGSNVMLEPGLTVSALVDQSIVRGLRDAGVRASAAHEDAAASSSTSTVHVTILEFWLNRRKTSELGTIEYRASIDIQGGLPGNRDMNPIEVRGSVSAGAVDMQLWRRSVETLMKEIAAAVEKRFQPRAASIRHAKAD